MRLMTRRALSISPYLPSGSSSGGGSGSGACGLLPLSGGCSGRHTCLELCCDLRNARVRLVLDANKRAFLSVLASRSLRTSTRSILALLPPPRASV
jgi:hypothetical protein